MTLIPKGYYQARAVRVKDRYNTEVWARWGRTSKGTQQVLVMFEILDEPHQGTRLAWFGYFTKDTWQRTIESLRHCGFQGDDLATINRQTLDRVVSVKVEHDTSQKSGRTYARVAFVNASTSGVQLASPMQDHEVRDFAAMMRNKIAGTQATRPARPQQQRPPHAAQGYPPGHGPDDDIPF